MSSTTSPYQGTVTTLNGTFSGITEEAYDSATSGLVIAQGQTVSLVRLDGSATPLSSLSSSVGGVVYDPATKLIYATHAFEIDAISPKDGSTSLLAGGNPGTADGNGSAAQFQRPQGITLDSSGMNLYVTDNDRIRKVTVAGSVATLPGSNIAPIINCGGTEGIAFDSHDGQLYVVDSCADVVYRVITATGVVSVIAGRCIINFSSQCQQQWNDDWGTEALFAVPSAIAYNPVDQQLYIADTFNSDVRRLSTTGHVTTLAGSGHVEQIDGVGFSAGFGNPVAITSSTKGLLFVGDPNFNASGFALIRKVVAIGPIAPPSPHGVALYNPVSLASSPYGFTTTADGSLWYSEPSAYKISRIFPNGRSREYILPTTYAPFDLYSDALGNVWYTAGTFPTNTVANAIGELTPSGVVHVFVLPEQEPTTSFTIGGDGNIWFLPNAGLGQMTPLGTVIEYVSDPASFIATGYTGSLWTSDTGYIEETSTSATLLKKYVSSLLTFGPLTRGPNKRMWFGQDNAVGEVLSNTVLLYTLPPPPGPFSGWNPEAIAEGGDKALWFTSQRQGYIGRMTAAGDFSAYEIPAPRSAPHGIITAQNGVVWFTDPGAAKIGRIY